MPACRNELCALAAITGEAIGAAHQREVEKLGRRLSERGNKDRARLSRRVTQRRRSSVGALGFRAECSRQTVLARAVPRARRCGLVRKHNLAACCLMALWKMPDSAFAPAQGCDPQLCTLLTRVQALLLGTCEHSSTPAEQNALRSKTLCRDAGARAHIAQKPDTSSSRQMRTSPLQHYGLTPSVAGASCAGVAGCH